MNTVLVKCNTKNLHYNGLKKLSAIEPPIWLAIMANYYKASAIVDAEVEDYTLDETINKIKSLNPDRVLILTIGSHPSAHIQQRQESIKLEILLNQAHIYTQVFTELPIDPCLWSPPRWDLLPMDKYRCHNWQGWGYQSRTPYGVNFTSIGCPFSCNFCCVKNFYGKTFEQRIIIA